MTVYGRERVCVRERWILCVWLREREREREKERERGLVCR